MKQEDVSTFSFTLWVKLYQSTKYTFILSSYTLSEATAFSYKFKIYFYCATIASKHTFTLITMASKYTFTVRLTSDEDDILMMEGRGDFAARKKKKH